ncbi:hypothetical protein CYLTODRAFT_266675 [Cylindrobasidium torrendii FP15055 ss-10]|uniref:CHAT domain-containing protein n=1 Tax=Cylindrobasidium torrendii FP15055 ss-10 TaxID=1314674 RepID=A0A0D7BD38_9AGAR|nr:hypothetical protein CYLTODRAFT_266675 [Cylindrobasidium torrendii FP15055 ss-10]
MNSDSVDADLAAIEYKVLSYTLLKSIEEYYERQSDDPVPARENLSDSDLERRMGQKNTELGSRMTSFFESQVDDMARGLLRRAQEKEKESMLDDDPNSVSLVTAYAKMLFDRFEATGSREDLERSIKVARRALRLSPPDGLMAVPLLDHIGTGLLRRAERFGISNGIEEAVRLYQSAVERAEKDNPFMLPYLFSNFGNAYRLRFDQSGGNPEDLEKAVTLHQRAVELIERPHPTGLFCLSRSLHRRFKVFGDIVDLDNAIRAHRQAMDIMPTSGAPDLAHRLDALQALHHDRFNHCGHVQDIDAAIEASQRAADLTTPGDPDYPQRLDSVGTLLSERFMRFGGLEYLEEAVSAHERAAEHSPIGGPHPAERLTDLSHSLRSRFRETQRLEDIDKALYVQKRAVALTSDDHPYLPLFLHNLGDCYCTRFKKSGELGDLVGWVSAQQRVVDITPVGAPDLPVHLNDLVAALMAHFRNTQRLEDIDKALALQKRVVAVASDDHPRFPTFLQNLGVCYRERYERGGELGDLKEAISALQRTVDLTPVGNFKLPWLLHDLSAALRSLFEKTQRLEDIDKALSMQKRAMALASDEHPNFKLMLQSLGMSFWHRFEKSRERADLEGCISARQLIVDLTPVGALDRPARLTDLGACFWARIRYTDSLDDIERGIILLRQAVDLTPRDHEDLSRSLVILADLLQHRFERIGDLPDIHETIAMRQRAVELTAARNPAWLRECLCALGAALDKRFGRTGDITDIEDAVAALKRAIELTPEGDPSLPGCLVNYGNARREQYKHTRSLECLEDAVAAHSKAADLAPESEYQLPVLLDNLGQSLVARFRETRAKADIERAIAIQRRAVELMSGNYSREGAVMRLVSLAGSYGEHMLQWCASELPTSISPSDLREVWSDFGELLNVLARAAFTKGSPSDSLSAARQLVTLASECPFVELQKPILDVHDHILKILIPEVAWVGHALPRRYEEMSKVKDAVGMAVAAALEFGETTLALEWFEGGRAIVWSQVQNLRAPNDELFYLYPELAKNLAQVAADLERAARREELVDSPHFEGDMHMRELEERAVSHRRLATRYKALLDEIRELPGFNSFLSPRGTEELKTAAHDTFVVCINVHWTSCSALLLSQQEASTGNAVHHVPLPDLSFEDCARWKSSLDAQRRCGGRQARAGHQSPFDLGADIVCLLGEMWNWVVKPVLDAIEGIGIPGEGLHRITWCTSDDLSFLPLHAAGLYDSGDDTTKAFNRIVSSYTPTLSSILPRGGPGTGAGGNGAGKIAVVIQPNSPLASPTKPALGGTINEAANIRAHIPANDFTLLEGAAGTVSSVLDAMQHHPWVHLACHGVQNAAEPLESALLLHDDHLTLSKLMETKLPHAELAFLSACETAMGDNNVPNEAVHLAAGMLAAGYKTVVGTLWSIGDYEAPLVADVFYGTLLQELKMTGKLDTAYALHKAVEALRKKMGEREFVRWMPFVHYGLRDPSTRMSKGDGQLMSMEPELTRRLDDMVEDLIRPKDMATEPENIDSDLARQLDEMATDLENMSNGNPFRGPIVVAYSEALLDRRPAVPEKKEDLECSIETFRLALKLSGPDGTMHAVLPDEIGIRLVVRAWNFSPSDNMDEAIDLLHEAAKWREEDDPFLPDCLSHLGYAFCLRFYQFGNREDINKSVTAHQQAVELSESHPSHLNFLAGYGNSLYSRFEGVDNIGDIADLNNAIRALRHVVEFMTPGDQLLPQQLSCLERSLRARFIHSGHAQDIDSAIEAGQRAADLTTRSHPDYLPRLDSIVTCFHRRFTLLGDLESLEMALSIQERAIRLTPVEDPAFPLRMYMNGRSASLRLHLKQTQRMEDIDRVLAVQQGAVDLALGNVARKPAEMASVTQQPGSGPDLTGSFENLGVCLMARFGETNMLDDLDRAIAFRRRALELTPDDHPRKIAMLRTLGESYLERLEEKMRLGTFPHINDPDLEGIAGALHRAAFTNGSPTESLRAARLLARVIVDAAPGLRTRTSDLCVNVHARILVLLSEIGWVGHALSQRSEEMSNVEDEVGRAVAIALEAGRDTLALECRTCHCLEPGPKPPRAIQ